MIKNIIYKFFTYKQKILILYLINDDSDDVIGFVLHIKCCPVLSTIIHFTLRNINFHFVILINIISIL